MDTKGFIGNGRPGAWTSVFQQFRIDLRGNGGDFGPGITFIRIFPDFLPLIPQIFK